MKFALASSVLVFTAVASSAFVPHQALARAGSSSLHSAVSDTYTFTKSEEIFAEAKTVRVHSLFTLFGELKIVMLTE
jgi:hypothetical protein